MPQTQTQTLKSELIAALQKMQFIPGLKKALQPCINLLKKPHIHISENDKHLIDFQDLIFKLYGTHITDQYINHALPLFELTQRQTAKEESPQQKKRS